MNNASVLVGGHSTRSRTTPGQGGSDGVNPLQRNRRRRVFGRAAEPWEVAATTTLTSDYPSWPTGEVISVSNQHP